MNENVSPRNGLEDVGGGIGLAGHQSDTRGGDVLGVLEFRLVDLHQLEEATEVKGRREAVHLLFGDVEFADEETEGEAVHVVADF